MSKDDKPNLLSIVDSVERILEYVQGIASSSEYYRNQMIFDATLMNFIVIGEMVDRLSAELKNKYFEVDWNKIKDFRNLVAHDYLGIDAEEVWQIIYNHLPKGDIVMVHASLRSVGAILGGPDELIAALLTAVGRGGTIMAYTDWQDGVQHMTRCDAADRADTAQLEELSPFEPSTSRARREYGVFPEFLRTYRGGYTQRKSRCFRLRRWNQSTVVV